MPTGKARTHDRRDSAQAPPWLLLCAEHVGAHADETRPPQTVSALCRPRFRRSR